MRFTSVFFFKFDIEFKPEHVHSFHQLPSSKVVRDVKNELILSAWFGDFITCPIARPFGMGKVFSITSIRQFSINRQFDIITWSSVTSAELLLRWKRERRGCRLGLVEGRWRARGIRWNRLRKTHELLCLQRWCKHKIRSGCRKRHGWSYWPVQGKRSRSWPVRAHLGNGIGCLSRVHTGKDCSCSFWIPSCSCNRCCIRSCSIQGNTGH